MKLAKLTIAILVVVIINMTSSIGFAPVVEALANDRTVDSPMPFFENRYETDHFVLKWTNRSRHSEDNISDQQIIKDTAEYLELGLGEIYGALRKETLHGPGSGQGRGSFSRHGLLWGFRSSKQADPVQLVLTGCITSASGSRLPPTSYSINCNTHTGTKRAGTLQKPYLSLHRRALRPRRRVCGGMVSRTCKLDTIFRDTKMDLYQADYTAAPFWIYCVQGNHPDANNEFMVKFFEKCEQFKGDEKRALNEVIKETYGSVDGFFKDFAKNRKNGFWSDACDTPYKCILGPDGKDLVEEIKDMQKKD